MVVAFIPLVTRFVKSGYSLQCCLTPVCYINDLIDMALSIKHIIQIKQHETNKSHEETFF